MAQGEANASYEVPAVNWFLHALVNMELGLTSCMCVFRINILRSVNKPQCRVWERQHARAARAGQASADRDARSSNSGALQAGTVQCRTLDG